MKNTKMYGILGIFGVFLLLLGAVGTHAQMYTDDSGVITTVNSPTYASAVYAGDDGNYMNTALNDDGNSLVYNGESVYNWAETSDGNMYITGVNSDNDGAYSASYGDENGVVSGSEGSSGESGESE